MSTDPHIDPQDDALLETALTVTDLGTVDWEQLRRQLPSDSRALSGLQALAEIASAHGVEHAGATAAYAPSTPSAPDMPSAASTSSAPATPAAAPAAAMDARATVSFHWGRLEAHALLGQGSFGEVWSAWDPGLHREVALKLWRGGTEADARRWLSEARRLARVRHPNVVTVHGADLHDGRAGLWLDRVQGRTLEDLIQQQGPLSAREAALVGVELCGALAAVHGAGLVHGDVKTRNVMREGAPGRSGDAGRIVLMDFGSSREFVSASADGGSRGTPLFTAPEVLRGGRPTLVSDLYALGVVLYRLVTGRYPLEARDLRDLHARLERGETVPLRAVRPELPGGFVSAVERALALDPARRFANAADFERALLSVLGGDTHAAMALRRARWRRTRRWAVAAGVLVAAGLAAWLTAPQWRRAAAALRASPTPLVADVALDVKGTTLQGRLGQSVANVGDVNGDGHADLLVGAPNEVENAGRAYLIWLGPQADERVDLTMSGESPGDLFGYTVASVGDLSGDGHPDFAVAANFSDAGGRDAGRVYVYHGGPVLDDRPDLVLTGTHPLQDLGLSLARAGDVNADGFDDLVVGAPLDAQAGFSTGRAYLWFGGPGMDEQYDLELTSSVESGQFGVAVEGIGDFNADGHDDFAVGANWDSSDGQLAGRAYVYFGGPRLDERADLVLRGHSPGELFGTLGRSGDVNGDGHPDLLVGADQGDGFEQDSGLLYIYFGGALADAEPDLRLRGDDEGDKFGWGSDASTDLDGDGIVDVVVAARHHSAVLDGAGRVYLYRGGPRMNDTPELVLDGPTEHGEFGAGVCVMGDLGGDGLPGLAVGALDSRGARVGGSVQVFDLARWRILSPGAGERWRPGDRATLAWQGATRADVSLSSDGGRTWSVVASRAGGREQNQLGFTVPAAVEEVRVRLVPPPPALRGTLEFAVPIAPRK